MRLAGVDGCHDGWLVASWQEGESITVWVSPNITAILKANFDVVAIDIPIGLLTTPRSCDQEARRLLGPSRGSSVFPAPAREVLVASSHAEACVISQSVTGRKISIQCWGIVPKIREVDNVMTPELQKQVIEVHPEVCFWAANAQKPIINSKKSAPGSTARAEILTSSLINPSNLTCPKGAGKDDLYDALIALWSAKRYASGDAKTVSENSEHDSRGLCVNIWY